MKKNIVIVFLLVLAVAAVVAIKNMKAGGSCASGCAGGVCTLPIPAGRPASEDPVTVLATSPLPKLLDLGAGKCIPCKMMAPILDEMKATFAGQLDVEFIDVWENEGVGQQYGIRTIPTQIFYDADGTELFRHEGFFPRADMLAKWQELGFSFEGEE
ncbi:thioredoxin family protein [Pontiella sulfatireligans]|uniref:Thioredoxin C-2 n=1 Tax=Pontiella sulfatireligans TaxID=2750658 RepID=A0A6C2URA8_9BACT|nr:thioredoxin family protein [Pontiella sulfatireligans]VGO22860.1 Thioredoxin C-2 [Pontiella sulfatireligans]